MNSKTLTTKEFNDPKNFGSLVIVTNSNPDGTKNLSFYENNGLYTSVDVQSGAMFTYLRPEEYNVVDNIHGGEDLEIRYLFIYDNKIIYSVDPARKLKYRSFNWELIPCK